jgi:EF hand
MGRRGMARMTIRHSEARLDALFAAADVNQDGKLTKDELANFIWKRFAKPEAQSVTKEELKSFAKQRISSLRAERTARRRHKRHAGAAKSETKPGTAQPKPQPKAEPKAEVKPAAGTAAAQMSAPSKPTGPAQPAASKPAQVTTPVNKPTGVSKAEPGPSPATAPKITGPKIGTSTTSGDVKAALFAARR